MLEVSMVNRFSFKRSAAFLIVSSLSLAALLNGCGGSEGDGGGDEDDGDDTSCDQEGGFRACSLPGDPAGSPSGGQQCLADAKGELAWKPCEPAGTASSTPLVLSFDSAPVELATGAGYFDLTGTMSVMTDWPAAKTPWLALDRSGNGAIDDGSELFGSATALRGGGRAANGFVALAELDSNGDGHITPEDAGWASLRLWSDSDGDRVSSSGELSALSARQVVSIDLGYSSAARCDGRGNCEVERASFHYTDDRGAIRAGAVIDVHLRHQRAE
jgi:hypothetical protein